MIANMLNDKQTNSVVIELFIIMQSYFAVPENIRLNSRNYFIMKIPNKQALQ